MVLMLKINTQAVHYTPNMSLEHTYVQDIYRFIIAWNKQEENFMFYTSGSTGTPKAINLSREVLTASATKTINHFNINHTHSLLCALNPNSIGGCMMIVRALVAQCDLYFIVPQNIQIHEFNALTFQLGAFVPLQIQQILEQYKAHAFSHFKNILIGGANLSDSLSEKLINTSTSCRFYQTYGMTETASHVALKEITEPYYKALPGYEFELHHQHGLIIHHVHDPIFTIQTNDEVELINNKTLKWLGRLDFTVNSGGVKIHLEQAENKIALFLASLSLNTQFTSYKREHEKYGEIWVLVVEDDARFRAIETELIQYCKTMIGTYQYPQEIRYVKEMVYLPNGKIDRIQTFNQTV
jgi:O-succinylbenzoic acid--CoA ligase